jgi:KDO2-lipid IV(A) lauroyltransferase
LLRKLKYFIEYILVIFFLYLFKILGIKVSSELASLIAKAIGKILPVTKLAKRSMRLSNIYKKTIDVDDSASKMWNNIGRNIAEMVHLEKINDSDYIISKSSQKNIDQIDKFENGVIFLSAHMGNWELSPKMLMNKSANINNINIFYKKMNNPMVNNFLIKKRKSKGINFIEKSTKGNKEIIRLMKKKSYFGILADLYISNGQKIEFLGRKTNAMTTAAKLSIKYDKPIIPVYCKRLNSKSKFEIIVEKAIDFKNSKNISSVEELTIKTNKIIEKWIKKNPEQWFWVHNRWKDKV